MAEQSSGLTLFYNDINNWLNQGQPVHAIFNADQALCASLENWEHDHGYSRYSLGGEMEEQFLDADLDDVFPFNNSDADEYHCELRLKQTYNNADRLIWIKEHATNG